MVMNTTVERVLIMLVMLVREINCVVVGLIKLRVCVVGKIDHVEELVQWLWCW